MARIFGGPATQRRGAFHITPETFNGIEEYIRWSQRVSNPIHFHRGMDLLVRFMAYANLGIAQKMSAGPYDPRQTHPVWAWRTPDQGIRRISERYYIGWKVRRLRQGSWMLYNDSREAFFIEFGISEVGWGENRHVPARRIRRPVRKLSQNRTLVAMMRTQAYHRVWAEIYYDPRRGRPIGRHGGFSQTIQPPYRGRFTGPGLGRRLP